MKTFILALVLLVIIITGIFINLYAINRTTNNMASELKKIEQNIKSENWILAQSQLDELHKRWRKTEKWMATVVDHNEIDAIKIAFAKLSQYVHFKEVSNSMAESASLKLLIEHLYTKEKVNLSNLL